MFSLIPWKKKNNNGGNVSVWQDRPDDFPPLARFRNEFESLLDRFWNDWDVLSRWEHGFPMKFREDLEDKPNEYVFQAELPGFEPDEIDVKVSGQSLSVRAEHKQQDQGREGQSYRYGVYQRCFTLPQGVDESKIDARYHNGVLEVHLPKTEQAQGKRIPVHAG
jgi:HSP20 family protein